QRQDQFILRSYTTVRDVYNARDRRLTLLTREIDILKSNLAEYRRRHRELRQQAASYQASGKPPPKATEEVLKELREQEASAMKLLAERRAQHKALSDNYAYYAARLVELKGDRALAGLDVAPPPEGAGEGLAGGTRPGRAGRGPPSRRRRGGEGRGLDAVTGALQALAWLVLRVPAPSSVKISSNTAWLARPSTIWALRTPPLTASRAQPILGSMPP